MFHVYSSLSILITNRFPWESARTGIDVTPECCPEVRLYEIHITGDIAFAARQYVAATGDKEWITSEMGGDLIYEIAHFWASRAIYNADKSRYEILSELALCFVFNRSELTVFFSGFTT
jgi:trehalose/maltose hydrolase-like predicted phosphorylase